ncbi:hypothetical protein [Chromobacterium haemolyticum]|uniref:hypothetical protein n=1 Tax=Chromobacterium haemolyticum TaxID=394935 RepID=UPI0017469D0C|nr:hypothetical protein [Chromobacterium haemolyticum]QOD84150.1 hypothetical protein IEZ30_06660 [Chromobacterium haemolyticum]
MSQQETGLYHKFNVTRTDGRDQPGGDRHGAEYLALDLTYDPFAVPAALAYAAAAQAEFPHLAKDIEEKVFAPVEVQRDEYGQWVHPCIRWTREGFKTKEWLEGHGIETTCDWMENEENADELFAIHEKTGSFISWHPKPPKGEGWHMLALHDTDDGPIAWWYRKQMGAL